MTPIAKSWRQDYDEAEKWLAKKDTTSRAKAFELYTRSAKSFPDSYLAAKCHQRRSEILFDMKQAARAEEEKRRLLEYYITL